MDHDIPTYNLPPDFLEAKRPITYAWDYLMENSPLYPLFKFPDEDQQIKLITWVEVIKAVHRAGKLVKDSLEAIGIHGGDSEPGRSPVVALLAHTDTVTYWVTMAGIMRIGFAIFVISNKNSPAAIAHLLKATGSSAIMVSSDASTKNLVEETLQMMEQHEKIPILDAMTYPDVFPGEYSKFEPLPPLPDDIMDMVAIIAHSSGSTSFPKAIHITHRSFVHWAFHYNPIYTEGNVGGNTVSVESLPMHHAMGFATCMARVTGSGLILGVFNPRHYPNIIDSSITLKNASAIQSDILMVVPSFLEEYCESLDDIATLKRFKKVYWGGGPFRQGAGNYLAQNGVSLGTSYGSTEVGGLVMFSLSNVGMDWSWFKLNRQMKCHLELTEEEGVFELFVIDAETAKICVTNTEINGEKAYAMGDLLKQHPTNKELWKIYGRADDQIMHSTGEKTNPGPMETIISRHLSIRACVIFGRGQFQAGVLIEPVEGKKFDPSDEIKLAEFRNEVWPSVAEANDFAPKHSRIYKEMIIVSNPLKPFLFTAKLTVRRQLVIKDYENEIAKAYEAVESSSNQDIASPENWDLESCTTFTRTIVHKTLNKKIGDDDDVFLSGADSLSATIIRNTIIRAIRTRGMDIAGIPQAIVYAHPTIRTLGESIAALATQNTETNKYELEERHIKIMEAMVEEYTRDFSLHRPSLPTPQQEAILLTGSTGSLGSHILSALLMTPSVARVFALNRPDNSRKATLRERQTTAFQKHGIDVMILDSPKLVLLEGDTSVSDFGLDNETLEDMARSITSIIHNAWKVDFNQALPSFEPLIAGVRYLVNWAHKSPLGQPPKIVFTSSIATTNAWNESKPVPEEAVAVRMAVGNGYGESKWVSEQILHIAGKETNLSTVIVRVGQLCGSSISGSWNEWEWFPSIIQSYSDVMCLPDDGRLVDWVPVDIAAAAVVEMRKAPTGFLHLVHPRPVYMSTIIQPVARVFDVPVVPYEAWLSKLETRQESQSGNGTRSENRAFKLIEFYKANLRRIEKPESGGGFLERRLALVKTLQVCTSLSDPAFHSLDEDDVKRWLTHWIKKGVISSQSF